jgi:hypothetical protein
MRVNRWVGQVLALGVIAFFGLVIYLPLSKMYVPQVRTQSWRTAQAMVISSDLRLDRRSQRRFVRYRYEVNGQAFVGRRYSFFWMGAPNAPPWDGVVPGNALVAYFDPANPAESVLATSAPWWSWIGVGIMTLFEALLVLWWIRCFFVRDRESPSERDRFPELHG